MSLTSKGMGLSSATSLWKETWWPQGEKNESSYYNCNPLNQMKVHESMLL